MPMDKTAISCVQQRRASLMISDFENVNEATKTYNSNRNYFEKIIKASQKRQG